MYCPRLDHFVRFNPNGTVGPCGHMVNAPQFDSLRDMEFSRWLRHTKDHFARNEWPGECCRCQQSENSGSTSIRQYALTQVDSKSDYLQVGGVLDNLCNAACQTCSSKCSTRIGSLNSRTFPIVDNTNRYWELPQDRITRLDINGGEPSYSKNYKRLIENLPPNLTHLRLNTNCSTVLEELVDISNRGIEVTVTASCDGIGPVFEYLRWPISWETFCQNLMTYKSMPVKLNLWTTVSRLNYHDLPNIIKFAQDHDIDYSYSNLVEPRELNVENNSEEDLARYIQQQDQLRGISIKDYIK